MNYLSIKSKLTAVIVTALMIMPLSGVFADTAQGAITIKVIDEKNQEFPGAWFIYQGTTDKGIIKRNGAKGESFGADIGNYFLTVNPINPDHQFYLIKSQNPQSLLENKVINFEVQYFKTQDQLDAAKLAMEAIENSTEEDTENETETEEVTESEEGEEADSEETTTEEESTTTEDSTNNEETDEQSAEEAAEAARQARIDAIRKAAAYRRSLQNVPQFNTAPANSEPTTVAASNNNTTSQAATTENKAPELAATGSPFLLSLLLPSMLGGIMIRKRK